jgi:hypothetical protein
MTIEQIMNRQTATFARIARQRSAQELAQTALQMARERGDEEMVAILTELGFAVQDAGRAH